jgi:photosystem II stability/assembly factor-like uncharacterized protein
MITSPRKNRQILRAIIMLGLFLTSVPLPNRASVNVTAAKADAGIELQANSVDKNVRSHILEAYGSLPLSFESNQGQSASQVKFLARGSGYAIFLTEEETVIKLLPSGNSDSAILNTAQDKQVDEPLQKTMPIAPARKDAAVQNHPSPKQQDVLRIKLIGANRPSRIRGVDELQFKSNYFIGKDETKWRTGISNFAKVHYEQVYVGIDMIFYGRQQQLEYDFQIAAGVNPAKITLALEGAKSLRLDAKGDLVLLVGGKEMRQRKPMAFQEINGVRQNVAVRYVRKGNKQIGFQLGRYDKSKPLVIDPVLVYGTYLGGNSTDNGNAIAVDANGSAYVTGTTISIDFPLVNPLPPGPSNSRKLFISKLNPTGTALIYSSFIGSGHSSDIARDVKVNSSGNAYVVGQTNSENFPVANAIQAQLAGGIDAYVMKLSPTGSSLVFSTYLGGMEDDVANSVAVDGNDNAIIVGLTHSTNFPVVNALQPAINRLQDAFVTKLSSTGSAFVYSTYLGGSATEAANGVATDAAGNAYVVGITQSGDFPLLNPVQGALADQTLLKSTNGGASWTTLTNGLPVAPAIYDIEIDPTQSTTLYLAANLDGAYKSTNGGTAWSVMNIPRTLPSFAQEIEIAPSNPATLFAGIFPDGLARSTNNGTTWGVFVSPFTEKNSLAVSYITEQNVYLSHFVYGAFASTDGGATFEDLNFPFPSASARCIAMHPSKQDVFYLGTDQLGIWKYAFPSWTPTGMKDRVIRFIVVDPSNPNTLYTSSTSNLSKSTDGGATWINISAGVTDLTLAETLAIDPSNSSVLYVGTRSSQIYKSGNGGTTWNKLFENRFGGVIRKIEIDPNSPNTLYVGADVAGDAFVTKINPTGSAMMFSTYFGGRGSDRGEAIAIDPSGNPIIVGNTGAVDLPTTSLQQAHGGSGDAFVAKFDIANHTLVYSTYVGGNGNDSATDIAVDTLGNAYITGSTVSTNFPVTADAIPLPNNGACPTSACTQAFLTKLNANGSGYIYSTYLGGSGLDIARGVAVDLANNAYVTGLTNSIDFPTTPNAFDRELTGIQSTDAFIVKIAEGTPFPICLKDDTNGHVLRVNTSVGEFEFVNCRKGWSVRGRLNALINGCKTELTSVGKTGLRISALINTCTRRGSASVIVDGKSYSIADPNITNSDCNCSAQ